MKAQLSKNMSDLATAWRLDPDSGALYLIRRSRDYDRVLAQSSVRFAATVTALACALALALYGWFQVAAWVVCG